VILDGKVFGGDRCAETVTSVKSEDIDVWYSGKAHCHGGNVQAVTRPDGLPLWVGPAEPGSVNDLTAARWHALPALYSAAALGMPCLADSGYQGVGTGIHVPVRNQPGNREEPHIDTRTRNACSVTCAAAEKADSPCSPSAGPPSSTSPPTPTASPR
jgi:hypothetical protein